MGQIVDGIPFGSSDVTGMPEELKALIALGRKIRGLAELARSLEASYEKVAKNVGEFFAQLRALKGIFELLAEQPGLPKEDAVVNKVRADMAKLRDKVDAICKDVAKKCTPMNMVDVIGKGAIEKRTEYAVEILNTIMSPANTKVIEDFRKSKAIPDRDKHLWLQTMGVVVQLALEQVMRSSQSSEAIRIVEEIVKKQQQQNVANVLTTSISMVASAVGNLPGPDSYAVAIVRLDVLAKLGKAVNRDFRRDEMALEIRRNLTSWFGEKDPALGSELDVALSRIDAQRVKLRRLAKSKQPNDVEVLRSLELLDEQRTAIQNVVDKRFGQVQSHPAFNWTITILNALLFIAKMEATEDVNLDDAGSQNATKQWFKMVAEKGGTALLGASALSSTMYTVGKSAAGFKSTKVLFGWMESPALWIGSKIITPVTGVLSIVDGSVKLYEGFNEGDPLIFMIGGFEVASGIALLFGLFGFASAGSLGVLLGGVAMAIGLSDAITEAQKDPLKKTVLLLVKAASEQTSGWDKQPIAKLLGVDASLAALRTEAESVGVSRICIDEATLGHNTEQVRTKTVDRVKALGFSDAAARELIVVAPTPKPPPQGGS